MPIQININNIDASANGDIFVEGTLTPSGTYPGAAGDTVDFTGVSSVVVLGSAFSGNAAQITSSPSGGRCPSGGRGSRVAGKDRTLVGLSRPRKRAFSRALSASPTVQTSSSRPRAPRPSAALAQCARSRRVGDQLRTRRRSVRSTPRPAAAARRRALARARLTKSPRATRRPALCAAPGGGVPRRGHRRR